MHTFQTIIHKYRIQKKKSKNLCCESTIWCSNTIDTCLNIKKIN